MAQPDLIPMPFAENATPGTIEPIEATTPTVPQDATWSTGFPQVTMQPLAAGGIPPRGQNFNGVLNALSRHIFHMQGGGQYKWSDDHGPYSIGDVLQSDDGLRAYVSIVNNNTDNFNTNPSAIGTSWLPWSGGGKVDTTTQINAGAGLTGGGNLSANRTLSADFASEEQAQELLISNKVISPLNLGQAMNAHVLGMGQTWQDVKASRSFNTTYTNTTGRVIALSVSGPLKTTGEKSQIELIINGSDVARSAIPFTTQGDGSNSSLFSLIGSGDTYAVYNVGTGNIHSWWELR